MGLASYGQRDDTIASALSQIVGVDEDNGSYTVDPTFIHYGDHTYSPRFTDKLVELLGVPPRVPNSRPTEWQANLAFCAQRKLEAAAEAVVRWGVARAGTACLCVSGGVGLNVTLNSYLLKQPYIKDVFALPLCSDTGAVCGAGLLASLQLDGSRPERLCSLALGHCETERSISDLLTETKSDFERVPREELPHRVARELSEGRVVAWFQGRMEAGPRALGHRSILADPRNVEMRGKVNSIVKHREEWRPLCPSVVAERMDSYFRKYTESRYMTMAFDANDRFKAEAPAVVHTDGTVRVQMVFRQDEPLFYALITEFGRMTGLYALLNTSFNDAGEPIVCTAKDALRTFWSTGLDILVLENFVIRKPMA